MIKMIEERDEILHGIDANGKYSVLCHIYADPLDETGMTEKFDEIGEREYEPTEIEQLQQQIADLTEIVDKLTDGGE